MYRPFGESKECGVNLALIDSAFDDINTISIELAQLLNTFQTSPSSDAALNILTKANVLIGFMISLRNQLLLFKRQSSIAGNSAAKDYLNELKIQMDGLKSITYSYGNIYTSLLESKKLDQKMM